MSRTKANLLLLLAGAMWGMGFVAQSTAMADVGPLLFIGLRFLAATAAVLPFAMRESRMARAPLQPADWRAFLFIGALLFGGMTAQQFGLLTTSVTNSGFLTGLYVVMVPLFGVALFREWPHPIVWPSAFAAFLGIWMLSGGAVGALTVGDWLTVLCAAVWALQVIMIARHAAHTGRPVTLAVTQFAVCAICGLAAIERDAGNPLRRHFFRRHRLYPPGDRPASHERLAGGNLPCHRSRLCRAFCRGLAWRPAFASGHARLRADFRRHPLCRSVAAPFYQESTHSRLRLLAAIRPRDTPLPERSNWP